MDAIYILTPLPHIIDCVMADLERKRYRKAFLIWTAVLGTELRRRIMNSPEPADDCTYDNLDHIILSERATTRNI